MTVGILKDQQTVIIRRIGINGHDRLILPPKYRLLVLFLQLIPKINIVNFCPIISVKNIHFLNMGTVSISV